MPGASQPCLTPEAVTACLAHAMLALACWLLEAGSFTAHSHADYTRGAQTRGGQCAIDPSLLPLAQTSRSNYGHGHIMVMVIFVTRSWAD